MKHVDERWRFSRKAFLSQNSEMLFNALTQRAERWFSFHREIYEFPHSRERYFLAHVSDEDKKARDVLFRAQMHSVVAATLRSHYDLMKKGMKLFNESIARKAELLGIDPMEVIIEKDDVEGRLKEIVDNDMFPMRAHINLLEDSSCVSNWLMNKTQRRSTSERETSTAAATAFLRNLHW